MSVGTLTITAEELRELTHHNHDPIVEDGEADTPLAFCTYPDGTATLECWHCNEVLINFEVIG